MVLVGPVLRVTNYSGALIRRDVTGIPYWTPRKKQQPNSDRGPFLSTSRSNRTIYQCFAEPHIAKYFIDELLKGLFIYWRKMCDPSRAAGPDPGGGNTVIAVLPYEGFIATTLSKRLPHGQAKRGEMHLLHAASLQGQSPPL